MSINCKKFKSLRAGFLVIAIGLLSTSSSANESTLNVENPKNSSAPTTANQLSQLQATVREQEKTIKLLLERQPSNEKTHALEAKVDLLERTLQALTSESTQSKQETRLDRRLESIESSLGSITNKDKYFSYADWAAVAITCVAVLLTIVGLVIAVLAFWGYREIIDLTTKSTAEKAHSVATQTIEDSINSVAKSELEKLINDGKLRKPLQDAVDMILRNDPSSDDKKRTQDLFNELDLLELDLDNNDSEDDENTDGKKG
ncbi:hypothetical protein [Vibrio natriegens]|uniref:hypothetical protein n=1 Tax=Vibrio natriegens TaxID=691 RepID=UPI00390C3293